MNIVVNAIAISPGGGLTILKQFIEHAKESKANYYIFISTGIIDELDQHKNINYLTQDKKNWIKRIVWDCSGFNNAINKLNVKITKVISLQNTTSKTNLPQIIYVHQPLPFTPLGKVIKLKDLKFLLYKVFYPYFIFAFARNDTIFVAQTKWMADALSKKNKKKSSILVFRPDVANPHLLVESYNKVNVKNSFLYPAAPYIYKNHITLLRSLKELSYANDDFLLKVTFNRGEYSKFDDEVDKLRLENNVKYLGFLEHEELLEEYLKAKALLFPSTIETFGLPLIEAASLGLKIVASDDLYAKETLVGYTGVTYIDFSDKVKVGAVLNDILNKPEEKFTPLCKSPNDISEWVSFFTMIEG